MKTFKRGSNFSRASSLSGTLPHGYLKRWNTINTSRRLQNQTFSKKRTYSSSISPPKKQVSQFRTQVPCEQSSTEIEVCNTSKMGPKSLLFLSIGSPFFYSNPIVSNPPSNAFKFSYFSTEKEEQPQVQLLLESAAAVIPHPQKAYKGGEDAHFISTRAVGVADGVGGWADVGVDPALYATKLMEGAKTFAEENPENSDPLKVMQEAYIYAKDVVGSSTACIVTIEDENIRAANLGDSGFMIVRDDKVIFRTKEQQHSFNFPFQLGTQSTSLPEHADIFEIPVQDGDLIILGSDGLFDNVYDEEIVEICKNETSEDPQKIADSIAQLASKFANHRTRLSPFAKAAQQQGHLFFIGGKLDDITVLASRVVKRSANATSSPSSPDQFSMSDSEIEGQKL